MLRYVHFLWKSSGGVQISRLMPGFATLYLSIINETVK